MMRGLCKAWKITGQACTDSLALIPDLIPAGALSHPPKILLSSTGSSIAAQKRFQEDCGNRTDSDGVRTRAKVENPADPNWPKEPFLTNVIVCVDDNDTTFTHLLIGKCHLSAKRGKTVILALGTPPGSSSLKSYLKKTQRCAPFLLLPQHCCLCSALWHPNGVGITTIRPPVLQ